MSDANPHSVRDSSRFLLRRLYNFLCHRYIYRLRENSRLESNKTRLIGTRIIFRPDYSSSDLNVIGKRQSGELAKSREDSKGHGRGTTVKLAMRGRCVYRRVGERRALRRYIRITLEKFPREK